MSTEHAIDVGVLMEALSRPEAYPHAAADVEIHQTHISVVFLAGEFAYKIKKPVNLGFVDFSTLQRRRHFCDEEVRLNRRLAPQIYLDVVPIVEFNGTLRFNTDGQPVEWAVRMKRLPSEATLESQLRRGELTADQIRILAARLADFHRSAQSSERISSFGRFDVVAGNVQENFRQTASHVGVTVSAAVYDRVRDLAERELQQHHALIDRRAAHGGPRDTHGDLRLEHVYCFPEQAPPNDYLIIDCIEFADRFRYTDPVADMAFFAMDLVRHSRRDLERVFADAYFQASNDPEGRTLLPLYSAYRAVVRAKVQGMELTEKEIDSSEREAAASCAQAHWLVALGTLEPPSNRPVLVMMGGLPGSGKSTLAQALAEKANFSVLRSDLIRKELAGVESGAFDAQIYTDAWTERTYAELLTRAAKLLWHGERVLIDANFRSDLQRRLFANAAQRRGVPTLFFHCVTQPEIARARLEARREGPSDADWLVYQQLAKSWQLPSEEIRHLILEVDTSATVQACESALLAELRQTGLF